MPGPRSAPEIPHHTRETLGALFSTITSSPTASDRVGSRPTTGQTHSARTPAAGGGGRAPEAWPCAQVECVVAAGDPAGHLPVTGVEPAGPPQPGVPPGLKATWLAGPKARPPSLVGGGPALKARKKHISVTFSNVPGSLWQTWKTTPSFHFSRRCRVSLSQPPLDHPLLRSVWGILYLWSTRPCLREAHTHGKFQKFGFSEIEQVLAGHCWGFPCCQAEFPHLPKVSIIATGNKCLRQRIHPQTLKSFSSFMRFSHHGCLLGEEMEMEVLPRAFLLSPGGEGGFTGAISKTSNVCRKFAEIFVVPMERAHLGEGKLLGLARQ